MAVTYYALLTTIGAGKLANATALGTTLKITQLAVGDGGGNVPTPDASRTQLVNEVRRAPLNRLSVDPANSAQIIAEQVIPEDVGGWWIREMGLYDEAGALIAYANCAPSYKPQLAEGSGRTQTVRIVLIVSNAASVELKIDPSVVLATREYVDNSIVTALNRLDYKQSVRAATTASITLSGLQTLDGIALAVGDRVLVKNQSNAVDNGLYLVASGPWRRATDADENSEVTPGLTVTVESGAAQADSVWQLVTDGAIVLGATALTFQNITNGLAKLASPAFSGTPTAPSPAQGDLSSRLATTTYVRNLVSGQLVKSVAGGSDVTLTSDEVGYGMLVFTGALTANINVVVPNGYQQWVVHNRTSGAFSLTLKTSAGTGVTVTQGRQRMLVCNSVDVYSPEFDYVNTPLLGVPTAPTAAGGTNTQQLATTAFVQTAISTLAPLASPNFSGNPSAPTAQQFDNDTSLATTAFVQKALGSLNGTSAYAASTNIPASDVGRLILVNAASGNVTLTLPSGLPVGAVFKIQRTDISGNSVTVVSGGAILGLGNFTAGSSVSSVILRGYDAMEIVHSGSSVYYAVGGAGALRPQESGYQRLPSGLLIQWGANISAASGICDVVWPTEFPNAVFVATAAGRWVSPALQVYVGLGTHTKTGGQFYCVGNNATPGVAGFEWMAIGY
ncbi:phage tail protein [Pseudomonas sp. PDM33]|uniref:phage tail protein n=1 Tax=unclassified Pseudomonas TaxID=196821 RepID=UPI00069C3CC3|nr:MULTISPECIES: phage tail protein [unclassified Pseudomonas]MBV7583843.1 phage tail protein [Pseudomonas sp. PDM33]